MRWTGRKRVLRSGPSSVRLRAAIPNSRIRMRLRMRMCHGTRRHSTGGWRIRRLSSPETTCPSASKARPSAPISWRTSNNWGASDVRPSNVLLAAALMAAAIAASALAFRPPGKVDPPRISSPLLDGAQIDADTLGIVERACQNCHSERTHWPWYSHIPPASWLLHRDVAHARDRFNLSRWEGYTRSRSRLFSARLGRRRGRASCRPVDTLSYIQKANCRDPSESTSIAGRGRRGCDFATPTVCVRDLATPDIFGIVAFNLTFAVHCEKAAGPQCGAIVLAIGSTYR